MGCHGIAARDAGDPFAAVLGLWASAGTTLPLWPDIPPLHTLTAMLVLGVFVFMRQYLQDQALIHLLEDSRPQLRE